MKSIALHGGYVRGVGSTARGGRSDVSGTRFEPSRHTHLRPEDAPWPVGGVARNLLRSRMVVLLVRDRSTDFGQVVFEPEQVSAAPKPAFDLGF